MVRLGVGSALTLLLAICSILLSPVFAMAESPVVARVDTPRGQISITQDRLMRYAQTRPGIAIETSLDELIEFELLAAEAAAAGLSGSPESLSAANAAKVRVFLGFDFVEQWTSETLPEDLIRSSYDRNIRHFKRPELRDVDHIIVTIDGKRPTDSAVDAKAKVLAEKIYRSVSAAKPTSREAFLEKAEPFKAEAESIGVQVWGQKLGIFPIRGRFVPAFSDTVFAHTESKLILEPFVTTFGYHVVWLEKMIPAMDRSFEEVEPEIRSRVVPEVRQMKLIELTNRLAQAYKPISEHPGVAGLLNFEPLQLLDMRKGLMPTPKPEVKSPEAEAAKQE